MPAAVQRQGQESSDAQTPPYKGQTLTAESHLFHDHIFTCPKPATFAAPDAAADPKDTEAAESEPGWAVGPRHPPGSPQSPAMPHTAWALGWLGSYPGGPHGRCSTPAVAPKSHHPSHVQALVEGWKWPWTRSCREGETTSIC